MKYQVLSTVILVLSILFGVGVPKVFAEPTGAEKRAFIEGDKSPAPEYYTCSTKIKNSAFTSLRGKDIVKTFAIVNVQSAKVRKNKTDIIQYRQELAKDVTVGSCACTYNNVNTQRTFDCITEGIIYKKSKPKTCTSDGAYGVPLFTIVECVNSKTTQIVCGSNDSANVCGASRAVSRVGRKDNKSPALTALEKAQRESDARAKRLVAFKEGGDAKLAEIHAKESKKLNKQRVERRKREEERVNAIKAEERRLGLPPKRPITRKLNESDDSLGERKEIAIEKRITRIDNAKRAQQATKIAKQKAAAAKAIDVQAQGVGLKRKILDPKDGLRRRPETNQGLTARIKVRVDKVSGEVLKSAQEKEVARAMASKEVTSTAKENIQQQKVRLAQVAHTAAQTCSRIFYAGCAQAQKTVKIERAKLTRLAQEALPPQFNASSPAWRADWEPSKVPKDVVGVAAAKAPARSRSTGLVDRASAAPAPRPANKPYNGGYDDGLGDVGDPSKRYRKPSPALAPTPTYRQAEKSSMAAYRKYRASQQARGAKGPLVINNPKEGPLSKELRDFAATTPGSNPFSGADTSNGNNNPGGEYSGPVGEYGGGSSQRSSSGGGSSLIGGIVSGIGKFLGQKLVQQTQPKPKSPPKPPKPSCRVFTATEFTIKPGESTTLQYAMVNSDYSAISPSVGSVDPRGGTVKVSPIKSTDYRYQAQNRYGTGTCPPVHITVLADGDVGEEDVFDSGTIVSCSPNRIVSGASAIVLWQCPQSATQSTGSSTEYGEFDTFGKVEGSARVAPSEVSKFVVRCRDGEGREVGRNSCKIILGEDFEGAGGNFGGGGASGGWEGGQPRTVLTVTNRQVSSGDTVTIAWEGFDTTNCTITGPDNFKELGNKGSVTGRMLQTSTFELSCSVNRKDLPKKSVTIQVI